MRINSKSMYYNAANGLTDIKAARKASNGHKHQDNAIGKKARSKTKRGMVDGINLHEVPTNVEFNDWDLNEVLEEIAEVA